MAGIEPPPALRLVGVPTTSAVAGKPKRAGTLPAGFLSIRTSQIFNVKYVTIKMSKICHLTIWQASNKVEVDL